MKPLPPYQIINGVIRLSAGTPDATTWPWPFGRGEFDAAWRARYQPDRLDARDAMELAGIADAYSTLISHPSRSLRERLHVLHRIFEEQP